MTPAWAVPGLLRALRLGPRGARARTLRALSRAEAAALQAEPARSELQALLHGPEGALARRAGTLIARRELSAFGPDLVSLLRRRGRRGWALRALLRPGLALPAPALEALALDEAAPWSARRAALQVLGQREALRERSTLERLLPCLAVVELHRSLLPFLRPHADEALLARLIALNAAWGQALLDRRGRSGLLARLFRPRPSSLGEWPGLAEAQRGFRLAIARVALRARSPRWLPACERALFETPGLTRALGEAWLGLGLRQVAPLLLERLGRWGQPREQRAQVIELLGRLGAPQAAPELRRFLPRYDGPSEVDGRAALVALGRLGERSAVAPFLAGALLGVEQALGRLPAEAGAPAHRSSWPAALLAGAYLGEARVGELGLRLLRGSLELPEVEAVLPEALARLGPLELEPTVEALLRDAGARSAARAAALELVRRAGLRRLLPLVAELPRSASELAAGAVEALVGLWEALPPSPEEAPLARRLVESLSGAPGSPALDVALERLYRRARRLLSPAEARALGREGLLRRTSGVRPRLRALRLALLPGGPEEELRQDLLGALADPLHAVRLRALRVGLPRGLAGDAEAAGPLAWLLADALRDQARDPAARAEARLLLRGPAAAFRARLAGAAGWSEPATFHGVHRELLDAQLVAPGAGPALGLAHAALLVTLARARLRHPASGRTGPYQGPLPRLDEARALPAPALQEALVELVLESPGYSRPDGLLGAFLTAPLARARAAALGGLSREGALLHQDAVRARLEDEAPAVRLAALELLRRHELARFAPDLRPRLEDREPAVRLLAARVLAGWGDAACLGLLAGFLAGPDAALRREALEHLARAEPQDAAPHLAPLLRLETPRAAAAALCALRPGRLPAHAGLRAALLELCRSARGPLRATALCFLPELCRGDAAVAEACLGLLLDEDPRVAAAAAAALLRAGARRHAPAVARQAAGTRDVERRLLLLGLLQRLDAPEAARGLLPLLLDEDPRVREAARTALHGARGGSLGPELLALLRRGLTERAGPAALGELVRLLDREGQDEAVLPGLVEALRCEERAVWVAALEVARTRRSDVLGEPLLRLLEARPPLAAPLLTLALGEVARCGLKRARPAVVSVLRGAERQTVRRQALLAAQALEVAGEVEPTRELARQMGREAQAAGERALAAVEPGLLARLRGRDRRDPARVKARRDAVRATCQLRGTESLAGRVVVEGASRLEDLLPGPGGPPRWEVGTLPWRARARVARLLARDPAIGQVPSLPAPLVPVEVARAAREALDPARLASWLDALSTEARQPLATWRLWLVARLRAGRPPERAELLSRTSFERPDGEEAARAILGAAEGLAPPLRALLAELIAAACRALAARRLYPWQATLLLQGLARARLRLGVREGREDLVAATTDEVSSRVIAADGDVPGLVAALAAHAGESRVEQRRQLYELLGEVGGEEAARALGAREEPQALARAALAEALGRTGAPAAAQAGLLRLLADAEPEVRAVALGAVVALGQVDREAGRAYVGGVLAGLESRVPRVQAAAAEAALRLELAETRPSLLAAWRGPPPAAAAATPLARAYLGLARPGEDVGEVVALLREGRVGAEVQDALVEWLVQHLPAGRLDEVGLALGEAAPAALVPALRVLGARQHEPATPAARALLRHPVPAVRAAAAAALGQLGSAEEDLFALRRLLGLDPAGDGALAEPPSGAAPAPAGAGEQGGRVLRLESAGPRPIQVIATLRAGLQIGLGEAKRLVDQAPGPLPPLPPDQVQLAMNQLVAAGATVTLLPADGELRAPHAEGRDPAPEVRAAALLAAARLLRPAEARALLLSVPDAGEAATLGALAELPGFSDDVAVGERLLTTLTRATWPGLRPPARDEAPERLAARIPGGHASPRGQDPVLAGAAVRAILRRGDEAEWALTWMISRAAATRSLADPGALDLLPPWIEAGGEGREAALGLLREAARAWWGGAYVARARELLLAHDPLLVAGLDGLEVRGPARPYYGPEERRALERFALAVGELEPGARPAWAGTLRELLLSEHAPARRAARAALRGLEVRA